MKKALVLALALLVAQPVAAQTREAQLLAQLEAQGFVLVEKRIIPTVIDQNPCAHLRMPRDMIFHGWSMRLFQAWQHSATMSS